MENNYPSRMQTTTTTTETQVRTNLRWDPSYVRSIAGLVKVACVVLDLIVFICALCSGTYFRSVSTGGWCIFVSMTGFWVTGTLLLFYLLHICEKFHVIPWLLIEMVFDGVWAFFYLAVAIDTAVECDKYNVPAYGAAAFFSFAAMAAYGYDAFLKYTGWRSGHLAQGDRTVHQTTVTSPAAASP